LSEEEWASRLTEDQCFILREQGTERAGSGELLNNKAQGIYVCAGCSLPLFQSDTKFESGTGWPSFFAPVADENVLDIADHSHGMVRTENVCARCGGHLGHVFKDGPKPTGLRYCMNSKALRFVAAEDLNAEGQAFAKTLAEEKEAMPNVGDRLPEPEVDAALAAAPGEATAVLAGGCFWCTEAVFEEVDGVTDVISGYIGGTAETANYEAVCSGTTAHAEAIKMTYDPSKVTYGQLLRIHFATHNPTEINRQGPDRGPQYRTAIFPWNEEQEKIAAAYIKQLDAAEAFSKPIATKIEPKSDFYEAEEYHQDYAKRNPGNPYIQQVSDPKVDKLKSKFPEFLR
jgi:peptide methionine sulfoxide reductase msrA/msrB